jgi:hypothetical protein
MSSSAKDPESMIPAPTASPQPVHGVRIFTYPKVIFIFPTMIAAVICGLGMLFAHNDTVDPYTRRPDPVAGGKVPAAGEPQPQVQTHSRFSSSQNILSMFFLAVFAFNMVVMAIDFPRFTLIAVVLLGAALAFFFLWLNVYFDLIPPIVRFLENIYAAANAQFYFLFAFIIFCMFGMIYVTRWLDYWEVLPNEILHHHGPLSDLERYPTMNMKLDKEIPDVLEFLFLGAGRLILHPQGEQKSIMLDNVLFINRKEIELKKLMSRLEVRVTTDQEVAQEK